MDLTDQMYQYHDQKYRRADFRDNSLIPARKESSPQCSLSLIFFLRCSNLFTNIFYCEPIMAIYQENPRILMNINYLQCLVEKGQMLKMGIGGSLWLFGHLVFSEGSLMGHLSGPWGPRICWATVPLIQTPPTPSIAFHRHYMSTFAKVAFLSCFVFAYLYLCICIYSFALLCLWFKLHQLPKLIAFRRNYM